MTAPPPKIVIDGRMILPYMTGAGRYLLGLCQGLNDLPGDERLELWLQEGLPKDHQVWGLEGKRIRLRSIPSAHMSVDGLWALPAALRRAQPDLLHYPHFDLPWLTPGRVVATLYDLKYIAYPNFFPTTRRFRHWIILIMTRYTLHRVSRVIVPSQSTADDLVSRLQAEREKLRVVPLGLDQSMFIPIASETMVQIRRRYGLEGPFVLTIGERRPHKNLDGLLRAFEIFRSRSAIDYHLVIVGRPYAGYRQPELLTQQLGLTDRVHFLDEVKDPDLPALYHCADAFALLSHYEGFGLPVLEAMACGIPVVVSNATSLPEVAGKAGLKVPPDDPEQAADALLEVIPGGKGRQANIAIGLEQARRFTWEQCARKTMQVYREAIET